MLLFLSVGILLSFLSAEILLMAQLRIIFYIYTSVIISFNAISYAFVLYFLDDERWMMRKIVLTRLLLD